MADNNSGTPPTVRRVVTLSSIRKQIKEQFEEMKQAPWFDPDFFSDEEAEYYLAFLIGQHQNDWLVIDDTNEEGIG